VEDEERQHNLDGIAEMVGLRKACCDEEVCAIGHQRKVYSKAAARFLGD
jgi:hypothetical protein